MGADGKPRPPTGSGAGGGALGVGAPCIGALSVVVVVVVVADGSGGSCCVAAADVSGACCDEPAVAAAIWSGFSGRWFCSFILSVRYNPYDVAISGS